MDRDQRWDRTQRAYDMLTLGKTGYYFETATHALEMAYDREETDEFVQPTCISNNADNAIKINDGDSIIFMNFRADRARQLTRAFTQKDFRDFPREKTPRLANFVTLTEYAANIDAQIAFPPFQLTNVFGEYIENQGLSQCRIAETEKYAHVTFFFNGGREEPFQNEERILIPSPKVATYDLKPEMSAVELTDKLVEAIESKKYSTIICNYANPDMVGHTGNFDATIKAIETIDQCLAKVVNALKSVDGEALITADHGNAERMLDPSTNQPHTAHTNNLVPLLYIGRKAKMLEQGSMFDIAPTMSGLA